MTHFIALLALWQWYGIKPAIPMKYACNLKGKMIMKVSKLCHPEAIFWGY